MNRKVYVAFVMGLAAGILNVLFAAAATLGGFPETAGNAILLVAADAACLLNLIGACICRFKRVAGGAVMLLTSLPLLVYVVLGMTSQAGVILLKLFPEVITALIVVELISAAAAMLCFFQTPVKQSEYYFEHADALSGQQEDKRMSSLVRDLYKQAAQDDAEPEKQEPPEG